MNAFGKLGSPAPDFDHPLDMLAACHGRIRAQCETLKRLAAHLPQHGADAQAQQAASAVLRYFDTAGVNHHADEEYDLFPRLLAAIDRGAVPAGCGIDLRVMLTGLGADHRRMDDAWKALRAVLVRAAAGEAAALDAATVEAFCALYDAHMETEERHVLPFAAQVLDATVLAEIGRAMSRRRGVKT
ncbi:MAG TPA: hemerythrin domain-containing protein [Burkholderiales bacterium]|nr:hemerythrin domain-containing protein [Burkholderiales bacterium]